MSKLINFIARFLSMFLRTYISNRKDHSISTLPNPHPEQETSQFESPIEKEIKSVDLKKCHTAILFPEFAGEGGLDEEVLNALKHGGDYFFFYMEDNENYTNIDDGIYIIRAYENGVIIGNWLVILKIIGTYDDLKTIIFFNHAKVDVVKEIELKGPDGLDKTICYFKFIF